MPLLLAVTDQTLLEVDGHPVAFYKDKHGHLRAAFLDGVPVHRHRERMRPETLAMERAFRNQSPNPRR